MTQQTTIDDFLGGQVRLIQSKKGLRATSDSVLVAAAVPIKLGESLLDVGTGNGVIALCVNARVPGVSLTGLDCQEEVLTLAGQNAALNQCAFEGILADLGQRPSPIHGRLFHHVVTNPPFYDEAHIRQNKEVARAYHQGIALADWLRFCLRHIRAKGSLTVIHRPEALPEILSVVTKRLGNIEVIPILSKQNEPAKRVIVRGWLGSKKPLSLMPGLVMHSASDKRTLMAEQILRDGIGI